MPSGMYLEDNIAAVLEIYGLYILVKPGYTTSANWEILAAPAAPPHKP